MLIRQVIATMALEKAAENTKGQERAIFKEAADIINSLPREIRPTSVCLDCVHCIYDEDEKWCEKSSDNFGTADGCKDCKIYISRKEQDDG